MNKELTVTIALLMRDHGIDAFQDAYEMATSVLSVFDPNAALPKKSYPPRQRRPSNNRMKTAAAALAKAKDWTAQVGEYFLLAEKNGLTEVPMRDVVNYIIANSERTSVTGSAYQRYIDAVETCGWERAYTANRTQKPRTFIKRAISKG